MKGATKITVLTLICIFAFTSTISIASAAVTPDVAQVYTTDETGSTKQVIQFNVGQTVYVEYTVPTGKTVEIVIVDDDDIEVPGTSHTVSGSGEFTFNTLRPGFYTIMVDGEAAGKIAAAGFFVLPEVMGAVAALGAGLAAFGIVKFRSKKI